MGFKFFLYKNVAKTLGLVTDVNIKITTTGWILPVKVLESYRSIKFQTSLKQIEDFRIIFSSKNCL
jgi:hypothetical protein